MKKNLMILLLFAAFGLSAQNDFYIIVGGDSYKVIDNGRDVGHGFDFGLQYVKSGKNKSFYWGVESVYQYRRQNLGRYGGFYKFISPGDQFAVSRNIQVTPFLRWTDGFFFLDGGAFFNIRITDDTDGYEIVKNFDFGPTLAAGFYAGKKATLALKTAFGILDISQYPVLYFYPTSKSLNLSLILGIKI